VADSLAAHIRRLQSAGTTLYVRIDPLDISRLALEHGQAIDLDLGRTRISGLVKTSGGSPWLAPPPGGSNARITADLRRVGFEHGDDVEAAVTVRGRTAGASVPKACRNESPSRNTPNSPSSSISMSDPLSLFDWNSLYARYDAACHGFDPTSKHLRGKYARTASDRALYYRLVEAACERHSLDADWYEALLYWKLYSQRTLDSKITKWGSTLIHGDLRKFLMKIPPSIPREVQKVAGLVQLIDYYRFPGMRTPTALPVRTTLLHVLYPGVVPIFDQMVLKAVGAWREAANQDMAVLRRYVPHAWVLADRHTRQRSVFKKTPVRLVDIALWLTRNFR